MKPNPRTLRRQTSIVKLLAISVFLLPSVLAQQKSGGESEVQSVVQTAAPPPSDFETKLDHGHFLVRRKGTLEWKPSSQFNEPITVGVLDGDHKIYLPTKSVKLPEAIRREDPAFPTSERNSRKQGLVSLHVVVDNHGVVREPIVDAATSPAFAEAAIEAMKKWTFQPAKLDGQPVAAVINVTMRFELF
jgi:TonB family protein